MGQRQVKYMLDRITAAGLVIVLSPILALIGCTIRCVDGSPVFFRQRRSGRDGVEFNVWKFRTMVVDADDRLDENGRPLGNRITKTGTLLRKSSLDELPNLFNIVRGEMSFIGPRPTLPEQARLYTARQKQRFRMKPGITGLAQVRGRNNLPWSVRIEYDNEYIDNFSLLSDMRILAKTVVVVAKREGVQLDRNPDHAMDLGSG